MIEREKLSSIYNQYNEELIIYIYSFTKSKETAEDILHDLFVKLIKYTRKYNLDDTHIRALLYKIARNLCIDQLRRNKKINITPLNDQIEIRKSDSAHENLEFNELIEKINNLIDKKDPVSRSVFYMKTELKMTYKEIADNLGISERTAKRKMKSILTYLADSLEKSGFFTIFLFLQSLFLFLIVK